MRVLVLSNFYPPFYIGGYELGCRDVVEGLRARGHDVRVLTSTYMVERRQQADGVYRFLECDSISNGHTPNLSHVFKKEIRNRQAFKQVCKDFKPDVLYVWNATHISISNIITAQEMKMPIRYFVSDHWLSKWETDSWYSIKDRRPGRFHRRLAWHALKPFLNAYGLMPKQSLNLDSVQFASHFLERAAREAGKQAADSVIIHWGIDVERFPFAESTPESMRLLYVGQVTRHKGVHTAVEAMKLISEQEKFKAATLTIVGGPDYEGRIARLVSSLGLNDRVRFTGMVARERLPELYREHDILVFPSVWDEPFSITVLEAMASGLAVVGTHTGGSPEILVDEVNALIFPKEDARECARLIVRLLEDPQLFESIRRAGRLTIEERFRLESMIDKIESSLLRT
jgi:glycogen synthase